MAVQRGVARQLGGEDGVEIATTPVTIHLRDSKNPQGPWLAVTPAAWGDFVTYASGS
ncbi:DUF397 domain-containing protein [Streptomyces sp. NPDC048436]|uniref:DUF397 domain-containing protein n=1 Tax=Streptomyces sp. NPDC048436 TaxID=3365550 RepID=UPI0037194E59